MKPDWVDWFNIVTTHRKDELLNTLSAVVFPRQRRRSLLSSLPFFAYLLMNKCWVKLSTFLLSLACIATIYMNPSNCSEHFTFYFRNECIYFILVGRRHPYLAMSIVIKMNLVIQHDAFRFFRKDTIRVNAIADRPASTVTTIAATLINVFSYWKLLVLKKKAPHLDLSS
jgi:hypothetical protein